MLVATPEHSAMRKLSKELEEKGCSVKRHISKEKDWNEQLQKEKGIWKENHFNKEPIPIKKQMER